MKKNLRSTCLLFLVFLSVIAGFTGRGSAVDDYNYSFNETNYTGKWDKNFSSPASVYSIWGYPNVNYTFTTTYNHSLFSDKRVIIFYWDCKNNTSDHTPPIPMSGNCSDIGGAYRSNCTNKWDKTGTYYVSVGVFQDGNPIKVSYWVPVEIRNDTDIEVDTFYMLDENEEVGCNNSYPSDNREDPSNFSYCGYAKDDYSFNVTLNATIPPVADYRAINETIVIVNWGEDNASDNSLNNNYQVLNNNSSNSTGNFLRITAGNFTHEWYKIGEKKINATAFHWDLLNGGRRESKNNNTTSILIIQDPKNFVFDPLKGVSFNLHNWGIFLSIIGLIIFYFTYTRNNVPIEISIFGLKPFYLKSVNSFTGTLIFVAGMYLWFVFGRCPWDIPILSSLPKLSDMYFNVLYREYETKQHFGIPYLSIMLGTIYVFILSLIIHLIAIPFYKGEFKIGEFLRRKITSTSAQPEMISHAVENKTNREN